MSNVGAALNTCFTQISTISAMYYGQYQEYATSWEYFRRVELYNSNVSTQRGTGNSNVSYWKFNNSEDLTYYRQGAILFATYLNYTTPVEKN
jgi:hypothetical protein